MSKKPQAGAQSQQPKVHVESYLRTSQGVYHSGPQGFVGEERALEREERDEAATERRIERRILNDEELLERRERDLRTGTEAPLVREYKGPDTPERFQERWHSQARPALGDTTEAAAKPAAKPALE